MALSDTKSIVPRGDQQGTLGTAAKSWGRVFINNPDATTALDITADAVTTADVITVSADALTSGAGLKIENASSSALGGYCIHLAQTNAAALGATPLFINTDGAKNSILIDQDYAGSAAATVCAINLNLTKATATTSDNFIYGYCVDITNTTATNGTNKAYGVKSDVTLTHAADAGTTEGYGLYAAVDGHTNGASTMYGVWSYAHSADTNYAGYFVSSDGVWIEDVTASAATAGGKLILSSNDEAVMADNHRLGVIEFKGAEDTSDTLSIGARIQAIARDAWDGSNNDADLEFYTTDGTTESKVLTLDADKGATFTGDVMGIKKEVIALNNSGGSSLARVLTAAESGALITIDPSTDAAHTIKITLPAVATGLNYKFIVTADATNTGADVLFTSAHASNDFRGHIGASDGGHEILTTACAFTLDVSVGTAIATTTWEVTCDGTYWVLTGFYVGTKAQIGTSGDLMLLTNSVL